MASADMTATGDESVRLPMPTVPKPSAASTASSRSVQPRSGPMASTTRPRPQRLASSVVVPTTTSPTACGPSRRSPPAHAPHRQSKAVRLQIVPQSRAQAGAQLAARTVQRRYGRLTSRKYREEPRYYLWQIVAIDPGRPTVRSFLELCTGNTQNLFRSSLPNMSCATGHLGADSGTGQRVVHRPGGHEERTSFPSTAHHPD